jgi:hypothetical protein
MGLLGSIDPLLDYLVDSGVCRVPKLFRFPSKPGLLVRDMKLTKAKVRWTLRQNCKEVSTKEIAR